MKYYYMLFLKCDVALLADAFEKFRNSRLKKKKELCQSSYLRAPALIWDAMPKRKS